ncbi:MAG TPA: sugar phosphate isomerase/epimerase [Firmicutes bacterium]|nr:sugar phosphate isomerase/epimerase [Bacillota bacterium]
MWTLSGFADEIAPELEVQLDNLEAEGIRYLELRGVWGKKVLDLSDADLERLRSALDGRGMGVSAIGSPIGKIKITDPFPPHLEAFRRALELARYLRAPFIRIFSFYVPEGEAERYRAEVMARLRELVAIAGESGVALVHENEKHIYGDIPARCLDIVQTVGAGADPASGSASGLRLVWDPANFVQCGVRPHTEGYDLLRPYIAYVHVKDALLESGRVTPAGLGDGEVSRTIAALRDSGFSGFFSIEPHLKAEGDLAGLSKPELFRKAAQAFKRLLMENGVAWQ